MIRKVKRIYEPITKSSILNPNTSLEEFKLKYTIVYFGAASTSSEKESQLKKDIINKIRNNEKSIIIQSFKNTKIIENEFTGFTEILNIDLFSQVDGKYYKARTVFKYFDKNDEEAVLFGIFNIIEIDEIPFGGIKVINMGSSTKILKDDFIQLIKDKKAERSNVLSNDNLSSFKYYSDLQKQLITPVSLHIRNTKVVLSVEVDAIRNPTDNEWFLEKQGNYYLFAPQAKSVFNKDNIDYSFSIKINSSQTFDTKFMLNKSLSLIKKSSIENIFLTNTFIHSKNKENLNSKSEFKILNKKIQILTKDVLNIEEKKVKQYVINIEIIVSIENRKNIEYDYNYIVFYDKLGDILSKTVSRTLEEINSGRGNIKIIERILGMKSILPIEIKHSNKINEILSKTKLDEYQKEAFINAISTDDLYLIQGPPGTGKTEVISTLIKYFSEVDKKIILASQTNIAIDNAIDRFFNSKNWNGEMPIRFVEDSNNIYNELNISETFNNRILSWFKYNDNEVFRNALEFANANSKNEKEEDIFADISVSKHSIIGVTTTKSYSKRMNEILSNADVLIIDEVSKASLPEILRFAMHVERIILVGDHKQLPPILGISEEDVQDLDIYDSNKFDLLKEDFENSTFEQLIEVAKKSNKKTTLLNNYRSRESVLNSYNFFYENEGGLKNKKIDSYVYKFNDNLKYFETGKEVIFIDKVSSTEMKEGTSYKNTKEADALFESFEEFCKGWINKEEKNSIEIAIIFPYAAQLKYFKRTYQNKIFQIFHDSFSFMDKSKRILKINTIDRFQGSEADVVFISMVRDKKPGFLSDPRRINVAMSRSRDMLIIAGNKKLLKSINMKDIDSDGLTKKFFHKILMNYEMNADILKFKEVRNND